MSGWYSAGLTGLLARTIPQGATICVRGVNADYVFSAAHDSATDLEPFTILDEQELTNPGFAGGVLTADNPKWLNAGFDVADKSTVLQGLIVYFKLADGSRTLLAFLDSVKVGLPANLTGVNVTAKWDTAGILKI